jgi:hypothetical protein
MGFHTPGIGRAIDVLQFFDKPSTCSSLPHPGINSMQGEE